MTEFMDLSALIVQVQGWLALYGLKVLGALAILVLGIVVAKWLTRLARRFMNKAGLDLTLVSFGGNMLKFFLIAFVVIAALNQLGVQTTSLIAVLGAMGLALGLALQSNLANLASGVLILIFRPFRVGELIDTGGTVATVEGINILSTNLRTPDGKLVIIPNGKIISDRIVNLSNGDRRRVDLTVGISYDDNLGLAKQTLLELAAARQEALEEPAPTVFVSELGDSSVNLVLRFWVLTPDYWNVVWGLTEAVKLTFDQKGLSLPYPQRDVHLHQVEQSAA